MKHVTLSSMLLAMAVACTCMLLPRQALADGAIVVSKEYHQCLTACTSKLQDKGKVGCITFDDFAECVAKDPKCVNVPKDEKSALNDFCRACGNASGSCAAAPAAPEQPAPPKPHKHHQPPPAPSVPSVPGQTHPPGAQPPGDDPYEPDLPPPPKTDQERCKAAGGVWVDMQVEDETGGYRSKKSCFTLEHAYNWIVELQDQINQLKKEGGKLSKEQLESLRQLSKMELPPDLMGRFARIETALEWLCRPAPFTDMTPQKIRDSGEKGTSLLDRCARMAAQVEENRKEIGKVRVTADNALALAKGNEKRLNELAPPNRCTPMLRAGALGSVHILRSPVLDEAVGFVGAEGGWMPCLSNRFAMNLFVGVGYSSELDGSNSAVMDLGAGFSYLVSPAVRFGIDLYGEHYYRDNEFSKMNFYGGGPHVSWLPMYADGNSFSPMFTVRAPFGVMRSDVTGYGIANQFGVAIQGFVGLAFWDGPGAPKASSSGTGSPSSQGSVQKTVTVGQ